MKHNIKITLILISMFLVTQIIGLFVISSYNKGLELPYGMQPPEEMKQESSIVSILVAFVIAIGLFFILTRWKAEKLIKTWFFVVTSVAIGLTLTVFLLILFKTNIFYSSIFAILIALPLTYLKMFKRNILVHNLTELLIYPGIAAVFVPILGIIGIIILLLIISFYDLWAVWHSEFMQKMAKYQINELKFFAGFFIPYASKKQREKIKNIKTKYKEKSEKFLNNKLKESKIKINLAILGGGDVVFPIITAGIVFKLFGLMQALIVTSTVTLALLALFLLARKDKFYPAMPFLTIGLYIGIIINYLIF
jgi:presenilin-like A22 family membrane protease